MIPKAFAAALRAWLPIVLSVMALGLAVALADLHAFRGLTSRVQWDRMPVIVLLVGAIVLMFGWRWKTLLIGRLSMTRAIEVAALGLGGNQVLPLRGGDALRVVLSSRGAAAPSIHAAVSAIALEKLFDLIAVAAFGLAAAATVMRKGNGEINIAALATTILAIVVATILTARSSWSTKVIRELSRLVRLSPELYRHLLRPLVHLRQSTTAARSTILLLQTAVIWLVLYVLAYVAIAQLIGISLEPTDVMVLLFAGSIGVAIPAAPSGIGTFHAAIVSAFILLGKPSSEGLVLAVAIHAVFFVGLCSSGLVALVFGSRRFRLSKLGNNT